MSNVDLDLDELVNIMEEYELPPRFERSMSKEELEKRIKDTKSKNSQKKANWAVRIFKEWLTIRQKSGIVVGYHVFKTFEEMTQYELDSQLQYFAFEARKKNGKRYPANTLREIFQGIGYYLKEILGRRWRLFNDPEFQSSVQALDAAMKEANFLQIPSEGPGPSSPVSKEQESALWEKNILGDTDPTVLLRTIFFCCGKFFGLRGGREHRELQFGVQIQLLMTEQGEALLYSNKHSKNFTGGLKQCRIKPKNIKIFQNKENPKRCLIRLYKLYASKRPTNCKVTAFYLKAKTNWTDDSWYESTAVGHNTLDGLMKNIATIAEMKGNYTNHSLKKTTGQRLKGMSEVQRKAHTGNRSQAQSVYEAVDDNDFQLTSAVLYGGIEAAQATSTGSIPSFSTAVDETSTPMTSTQAMNLNTNISHVITSTSTNMDVNSETLEFQMAPRKQMKIDVDAENNKLSFHFF